MSSYFTSLSMLKDKVSTVAKTYMTQEKEEDLKTDEEDNEE